MEFLDLKGFQSESRRCSRRSVFRFVSGPYTQKTTRSIAVNGGEMASGFYDNNGSPIMQRNPDMLQEVTDTLETE